MQNKGYRRRVKLKNELTFSGQNSKEKIHGDGDSESCFKQNSNYNIGLFSSTLYRVENDVI